MPEYEYTSIFVEQATWLEVQQSLDERRLSIVPIGASCKEHGPHLPLNTDYVQARWLAEQIAARFTVIVWPVVGAGYYPAFVAYPGSWSINEKTFVQCMQDIITSIARHADNPIVLLNTGISTIAPLQESIAQSDYSSRCTLINVYAGQQTAATVAKLEQQRAGGHADEIETSIMLAIDPDCVQMEKAQVGLERIEKGRLNPQDPTQPNYSPSGSMGNPTLASAEKGQQILASMLQDIFAQIDSLDSR